MRVAHLCRRLEISPDWLKRLERAGVVPPARRDLNGHRRYDEEDLERLRELLLQRKQGGRRQNPTEEATPTPVR